MDPAGEGRGLAAPAAAEADGSGGGRQVQMDRVRAGALLPSLLCKSSFVQLTCLGNYWLSAYIWRGRVLAGGSEEQRCVELGRNLGLQRIIAHKAEVCLEMSRVQCCSIGRGTCTYLLADCQRHLT
jgi:hypothetical protein